MHNGLTRRGLLIGGAVLFVTGCTRQAGSAANKHSQQQSVPPWDLGGRPSSPSAAAGGTWYQVTAGDTLSSIARRSGLEVDAILQANDLATSQLVPGTQLWLPGVVALGEDPLSRPGGPQEAEPEEPYGETPVRGSYKLVRRSEWTSVQVKGNNNAMDGVQRITVHHTGEHAGLEGVPEVEVLQRIEHYHQHERGWAAIGYHYVVGKTGKVYEGRPARYQGAHVSGANEHNLGISVVGDFNARLPNSLQLAALDSFLTDSRLRFKVGKARIYGHRELGKSECPGNALFAWVRQYRA